MNTRSFVFGAAASAVLCLAGTAVFSQPADKGKEPPKGGDKAPQGMPEGMDMAKMMEDWAKTMNPGEHHKALEPMVGKWKTVTKAYFGGPDVPPSVSHGTSTVTWVLGGRFVHEMMKGEMMMPDATGAMKPIPFEGSGLVGYNNGRKVYEGTWADNMGTQILTFSGTASPDHKTFTSYGTMDEPMLGVVGRHIRYVTQVIDNDHHTFTMYDLHAGENYKAMEISYERVK